MSKISLKHSGGNVVSLNSPTSAPTSADVAFKLPNADGTSGQAIVTDASGNLSFASVAGGKILQVISAAKTDTFTTNNGPASPAAITDLYAIITPSSSSNKVLITVNVGACSTTNNDYACYFHLYKNGVAISGAKGDTAGSRTLTTFAARGSTFARYTTASMTYLDSPATTSATTYQLYMSVEVNGGSAVLNRSGQDTDQEAYPRTISTFTVMEVAA